MVMSALSAPASAETKNFAVELLQHRHQTTDTVVDRVIAYYIDGIDAPFLTLTPGRYLLIYSEF